MLTNGTLDDLEKLDELAVLVINEMIKSSIPQWELDYPRFADFKKDILSKSIFLFKDNGKIIGTCTVLPENDPAYQEIDSWIKNKSLVIHRMLVHPDYRKHGIANVFIENAVKLCKSHNYQSIKTDTHLENFKMRNFLRKNGFIELGYLKSINRLAYELVVEE